jgi:hypothetical protein
MPLRSGTRLALASTSLSLAVAPRVAAAQHAGDTRYHVAQQYVGGGEGG